MGSYTLHKQLMLVWGSIEVLASFRLCYRQGQKETGRETGLGHV